MYAGSRAPVRWSPAWAFDPRVYQPGSAAARSGRISKQGSPQARWALVEAALSVVQQPGPLHAFYQRIKARKRSQRGDRRGRAQARRPVLLHAHARAGLRPPATLAHAQKLRRLEVRAGAPARKGKPSGVRATREKMRHVEKQLAQQAEASYKRFVADWKAASPTKQKAGASVTAERA